MPASARMLLALLLGAHLPVACRGFAHGWGSVGEMLAGDFGTHSSARYDLSPQARPNWEWLANNYAAITINGFGTLRNCGELSPSGLWRDTHKWNCSGESTTTQAARILKEINPKIKVLWCCHVHVPCTRCSLPPARRARFPRLTLLSPCG